MTSSEEKIKDLRKLIENVDKAMALATNDDLDQEIYRMLVGHRASLNNILSNLIKNENSRYKTNRSINNNKEKI